jgi:hypothetical protein
MNFIFAVALCLTAVVGSTALHYEAITRLDRFARKSPTAYPTLFAVISGLIALHLFQIAAYAAIFFLSTGPLDLGYFEGKAPDAALDYFYYAAEAYTSLGYGNVTPAGEMRLIASITPLNGILLLAWSGSFLFSLVEDWRNRAT